MCKVKRSNDTNFTYGNTSMSIPGAIAASEETEDESNDGTWMDVNCVRAFQCHRH